jgi:SNF2 family DNA or RNA helicase
MLLTNMETVAKEIELIRLIHWHVAIIDEAHT